MARKINTKRRLTVTKDKKKWTNIDDSKKVILEPIFFLLFLYSFTKNNSDHWSFSLYYPDAKGKNDQNQSSLGPEMYKIPFINGIISLSYRRVPTMS